MPADVFRFVAIVDRARHLRKLCCKDARQSRLSVVRLQAVYDGMSRFQRPQGSVGWIAKPCGTGFTGSTKRDRMASPTARARAGRATRAMRQMIRTWRDCRDRPRSGGGWGFRWRRIDLKRVIEARFGVIYSERWISRLLGELGFAHISCPPEHPRQDKRIIEAFKKTSPTRSRCIS